MVIVRPGDAADVEAVARTHSAARRRYYRDGGYEPDIAKELGVGGWAKYFDDPACRIAVADVDGGLVGFACAREPDEDRAGMELLALYVDPDTWSRGVGSALHSWFVGQLQSRPRASCGALEVWAGNQRARTFYEARGWRDTGRVRPGPLDLPFVSLTLDSSH